ncbi:unnamed protein product [Laminaria digitata]
MLAGLLYLIGLIAVLASIAIAGYGAPDAVTRFTSGMEAGNANALELGLSILSSYAWALWPIVGGLVLMGFGRIIMLLGAINRSLRGQG